MPTILEATEDTENNNKRKVKDLPIELSLLDNEDHDKFELALEVDNNIKSKDYGKEFLLAQFVNIEPTIDCSDGKFSFKKLTLEQMRKLCKNIGIANCGSHSKFNCRKAITTYFRYQEILNKMV
jgi:hypothetical protein